MSEKDVFQAKLERRFRDAPPWVPKLGTRVMVPLIHVVGVVNDYDDRDDAVSIRDDATGDRIWLEDGEFVPTSIGPNCSKEINAARHKMYERMCKYDPHWIAKRNLRDAVITDDDGEVEPPSPSVPTSTVD